MITQWKAWFLGRSDRERRLLAIAAGLAALVLLVFGIALPVYAAVGSAEKELDAAIQRRGAIEAVVTSAKSRSAAQSSLSGPSVAGGNLEAAISDSATAAGFELADGAAIGIDEYRFRLASTKAGALLAWITNLENQGIELSSISVKGSEGGFVTADVRVRRKI